MSWGKIKLGDFLEVRDCRFKPNDKAIAGLKRIDKIDFSGRIVLSEKPSNTDMILVKHGDLVISGINVEKGAMNVYQGKEDITATIHYSSYTFDKNKIDIEFLKHFLKSLEFRAALKEQVPGGIKTEIKPKHILSLLVTIPTDIKHQQSVVKVLQNLNSQIAVISNELQQQRNIVKQLRKAFLLEAMQGKLVKHSQGDGNASDLLEKILSERTQLKKNSAAKPIKEEEIPFKLPDNWIWCRLGDVVTVERGRFSVRPRNDPSYFGGPYLFIQIGSLDEAGSVVHDAPQTLNEKGFKVSKEFPKGTIAIAIVGGTIGNLGVLGRTMCFTDSIVGIRPATTHNQDYILNFLRYIQPEVKRAAYQMAGQPNIKIPTLTELLMPLPPLSQQLRTVKKLDEMMQLCDELEKSIEQSKQQNELLLQQVLREALQEKPASKVIRLQVQLSDEEKRDLLGGYLISKADLAKNFGHIKLIKHLVTAEYFAETPMPRAYQQHKNGPYDAEFMRGFAYRIKKNEWFEEYETTKGFGYKKLEKADEIEQLMPLVFPDKKELIDFVVTLMNKTKSDQAEIIATVYAVWNDLLINSMTVNIIEIKKYFFKWSDHKRKAFTEVQVEQCYKWMQKVGLVPKGTGNMIMRMW
jgi:type I restriction enzyme S subunit